jgi:hypothetical protein
VERTRLERSKCRKRPPLPTRRIGGGESSVGATVEERPFRACPEPVEGAALRVTEEKAFRPGGPLARAWPEWKHAGFAKTDDPGPSISQPEFTTPAGVIPSGAALQAKRGISRASIQEGRGVARG